MSTQTDHLLFSKKWTKGEAVWWRPGGSGYTMDIATAGRFTEADAKQHQRSSHGDCIAIHEDIAAQLIQRHIVDMGDGNNRALLEGAPTPKGA